jgi:hypothetical protein
MPARTPPPEDLSPDAARAEHALEAALRPIQS